MRVTETASLAVTTPEAFLVLTPPSQTKDNLAMKHYCDVVVVVVDCRPSTILIAASLPPPLLLTAYRSQGLPS